ncbi:MAG: ATP-binding protein, partial [Planctomycetota bacterium]
AVANVMEHAYPDTVSLGAQEIELTLDADDSEFRAVIRDSGVKFDTTQLRDVNIRRHVKEGHNGGLGVYMMRRIMDEVNYSFFQNSCNELQMIKWARK